jgi:CHAD domain-containing protein
MHAALDATTTTTTDTDTSEPGDPIPWHDWRRRAKDLRYALELLHPAAPAILTGAAEAAKQLTDHLGEDHDLAVLLEAARESGSLAPDDPAIACLDRMVGTRRTGLQAQARTLGACLYAESPAAFTRRLRAYWRAASN